MASNVLLYVCRYSKAIGWQRLQSKSLYDLWPRWNPHRDIEDIFLALLIYSKKPLKNRYTPAKILMH